MDRVHDSWSMSPWDYIKPGSLIDIWVAWIRISKGVWILLVSPIDRKMNDLGRASTIRRWRGSAPRRGAMASPEQFDLGAPVHRKRWELVQSREGLMVSSPRWSSLRERWWLWLAVGASFFTSSRPAWVLLQGPPTVMKSGTRSPSSSGAPRLETPACKAVGRCSGAQAQARGWRQGKTCDRTTSGRGSSLGSTWAIVSEARTQSTHISTIPYIEVWVKVITTLVHVLIIQKMFKAKITLRRINQSLRKWFLSMVRTFSLP
jgi:hypothetical protein